MSKEAMKLALEALEASHFLIHGNETKGGLAFCMDGYYSGCFDIDSNDKQTNEAITALREALDASLAEQPAQQEPVEYWTVADGWVSEQAEVPAAVWVEPDFWEHCNRVNCGTAYRLPAPGRQPLYTSPLAQRTWVGLTDKEYQELHLQMGAVYFYQDYGRAIEAKLKEKNT